MARFYVGQRVRIVFARYAHGRCCVGLETVVDGFLDDGRAKLTKGLPNPSPAKFWNAFTDQLEPLTDPGREVVSWSECVWKPEHLREKV